MTLDFPAVREKRDYSSYRRVKGQKYQGSDSVNEKSWPHIHGNTAQQEKLRRGRFKRRCLLAAAGYRGNQQNAIAFLEGAGFTAEEGDRVLLVPSIAGGC